MYVGEENGQGDVRRHVIKKAAGGSGEAVLKGQDDKRKQVLKGQDD